MDSTPSRSSSSGRRSPTSLLAVPLGRLADRIGRAPVFIAGHVLLIGCYLVLRTSGRAASSRPR